MIFRALALGLCLSSLPAEAFSEFRFQIPAGFRDISPGQPGTSYSGLPDALVAEAKSGKYAAFGMDFSEEDGFYENFNAVIQSGALRVDESFVSEHKTQLPVEYGKLLGAPVTIVEHGVASLGGVPVVRAVYDVQAPDLTMRQMQYLVPGGNDQWAILTYSATPSTFDRYRAVFESSAAATQGGKEAKLIDFGRAGKWGLYGAGIGAIVGLISQLAKKREKKTAAMPRRVAARPAARR
ncbi:MAG TPA: hypothetical protein VJ921_10060 [Vicinamibacteria bacterium]|nr:hypothetical protein [Vicinamibacteria bacterium]